MRIAEEIAPARPGTPGPARPDRPRPSLPELVFAIWAVVIPVGFAGRLLNGDGDPARHLRLGALMLDRGGLIRQDVWSHTASGRPFLAFEWLSEVTYAGVERIAGLAGVAVFAGLLLAVTFALLTRFMLRRGADPLLAYLTSMAAAVLTAGHWIARPHLFTLLAAVLLLDLLDRPVPGRLWPLLPLFAVWANLHGGYVFGFALIGAFLAGHLVEAAGAGRAAPERAAHLASARSRAAALGLALGGSLLNPYGGRLLLHVGGFFGRNDILHQTDEFLSPDFHRINGQLFLLALLAAVGALSLVRRRPPWGWLFVILGTLTMALLSRRNIELFAVAGLPLVALHATPEWRRMPVLRRARSVFDRDHRGSRPGIAAAVVALLLLSFAAARGRVAGIQVVDDRFDPGTFPVEMVHRAREAGLTGPLFHEFTWGGYLLHEWPEQRVFIDGGTDFYGEGIFRDYLRVWSLDPGWREVLRRWQIRWVLVAPQTRLAAELVREPGWSIWGCDSVAVMIERTGSAGGDPTRGERALERCAAGHAAPPASAPESVPAQEEEPRPGEHLRIQEPQPDYAHLPSYHVPVARSERRRGARSLRSGLEPPVHGVLPPVGDQLVAAEEHREVRLPAEVLDVVQAAEPVPGDVPGGLQHEQQAGPGRQQVVVNRLVQEPLGRVHVLRRPVA